MTSKELQDKPSTFLSDDNDTSKRATEQPFIVLTLSERDALVELIQSLERSILHLEGMSGDSSGNDKCEVHVTFGNKPSGLCTTYEHFKKLSDYSEQQLGVKL